ncbi:MAG: hypothetical protein MJ055_04860 [Phascolarctobacterium sp.]|nr:hypothetical protein [Phascolarctobacterium sp.]
MYNIVINLFNDLGLTTESPYMTGQQVVTILAFVFAFEIMIRLISALTDLMRK